MSRWKKTQSKRSIVLREPSNSNKTRRKRTRNRILRFVSSFALLKSVLRSFRAGWVFFLLVGAMAVFVLFAAFSPYFEIQKINIERNNPQFDISQIDTLLVDYYGRNLLFVSYDEIRYILTTALPEIQNIKIDEKWPSELILTIDIAKPAVVFFHTDNATYAYGSDKGIILPGEVNNTELDQIDVYQYSAPFEKYNSILQPDEYKKIIETKAFLQNEIGLPIKKIDYYYSAREVHMISRGDMALWIDIEAELMPQLLKLIYASEEIKLSTAKFEHIDLRIPNQLFWK